MTIYNGKLDRFGYELNVFCKTKKDCVDELMLEYVRVFKQREDGDPMEDIAYDRGSELTYYEQAKEDICIYEYELNKVEWE